MTKISIFLNFTQPLDFFLSTPDLYQYLLTTRDYKIYMAAWLRVTVLISEQISEQNHCLMNFDHHNWLVSVEQVQPFNFNFDRCA